LKNIIHFGAVDCDEEKFKPLCGHFQVKSLPTVLLFKSDLEQVKQDGKVAFTKSPVSFDGARKAATVANWALTFLPDKVSLVTSQNFDGFFKLGRSEFSKVENFALFFQTKKRLQIW